MSAQVIDLCNDDEEAHGGVAASSAAPAVIDLLDDSPVRGQQHGKENERENSDCHDDWKPAAQKMRDAAEGTAFDAAMTRQQQSQFAVRLTYSSPTESVARMPQSVSKPAAKSRSARKHSPIPATAAIIDVTQPGHVIPPPYTPLDQVLEIFPDVDRKHAQSLLQTHGNFVLVSAILAESSYPKSKTETCVRDDGVTLHRDKRQCKYDFMSASSFDATADYVEQARAKLCQDFPFLSSNGVKTLLKTHQHYAICHDAVCRGIMDGPLATDGDRQEEQYRLLKSAMTGVHLTDEQHTRLMVGRRRTTVLHPRRSPKKAAKITNAILLKEIDYVKQKEAEWMEEVNIRLIRKQNRAAAERAGATMECPCCCFDVAVDEMIACRDEGHLFCVDCLRRFAENQIFTLSSFGIDRTTGRPATDLLCMHSEGCSSGFHVAHLRKALPEKIMAKYDELQYRAAVDAAGIELL